jgi:hypothetical protein
VLDLDEAFLDVDVGRPVLAHGPELDQMAVRTRSRSEKSRLRVPMTFVCCVLTAWRREIIEYGAEGCSP